MIEKKWTLDVESNRYHLIPGKFYLIGNLKECEKSENYVDIRLKSQSVDAKHCVLDVSGDALYIYDLHSKLGTFYNGKRLESMLKQCVTVSAQMCFGEVDAQVYPEENLKSLENCDPIIFLAPTQRAPRSSLANTSTRLFSSPDASIFGDTREESFNIPETQHIKRVSIGNSTILNTSLNKSYNGKNFEDESFIPETQMPNASEQGHANEDNLLESNLQKSSDIIRICTQDFNENLFENADVDDMMFSSMAIPNIKHNPVILTHSSLNENMNNDTCKPSLSSDTEMEALNWSVQSKNYSTDGTAVNAECAEREDVCTPDLFDLPLLAQINMQAATEITNLGQEAKDDTVPEENVHANKTVPSTAEMNINLRQNNKAGAQKGGSVKNEISSDIPISDGVCAGDGYAEEIDLMPTQVFVPIAKRNESRSEEDDAGAEISLSGKENIQQTDFSLEQTQIFEPFKDQRSDYKYDAASSEKNKSPSTERNINSLATTQIFTSNSMRKSKVIGQVEHISESNVSTLQPNSTLSTGDLSGLKSNVNFLHKKDKTSKKSELAPADITEKEGSFKKPKQSKSTSSKRAKDKYSSVSSAQSESEDLQLCTPKWISDNFDELSVERNASSVKKRMLFGSDSEDESVELNKLTIKKDSKDFDRLLSNIEDMKAPAKFIHSKASLDKQAFVPENSIPDITKTSIAVAKEVSAKIIEKAPSIKKEKNTSKKPNKSKKEENVSNYNFPEAKRIAIDIKAGLKGRDKIGKDNENKVTKRTTIVVKEAETSEKDAPSKRKTRLRSIASDLEMNKANNSSGPSQAKQRKVQQKDEPENRKRVTRSHSKAESQESITSTKSTGSTRSTRKRKNTRDEQKQSKMNSSPDRTVTEASKPTKTNETKERLSTKSTSNHSHKRGTVESSNEQKNLKRSARTLQVAMTMVEPKLFHSLVENSPGNWCVANDPTDADVLVMDKGNRTLKFLIAMAKGIPIVTSKWLETFNNTKTVPRGATHFFRDHEFEKRHKFSLFKSLELARKSKLFEGYDFLTTPGILPQPAEMKQIIECAGGKVHTDPPAPEQNQKIYLISTENDKKHWHKYRRSNNNIRITNSEGVMASVMRQTPQPLDSNIFA